MSGPSEKNKEVKALTSIHTGIHCAATPDTPEEPDELDQIAIDTFLDTLAEVALAVSQRNRLDR